LTLNDKEYITPINPSAISILYHLSSIKLFKKVSINKPFELNFSSKSIIAQKGFLWIFLKRRADERRSKNSSKSQKESFSQVAKKDD
jgi:hypothetical protein